MVYRKVREFYFSLILFHVMGLVFRRRIGTEKKYIIIIIIKYLSGVVVVKKGLMTWTQNGQEIDCSLFPALIYNPLWLTGLKAPTNPNI